MEQVRVRIGPSPTGEPHVGTAWITLFNLAFARKHGGKLVLRVEDTDQERSRPEWEQEIMAGLRWLGLSWDEGPDIGGPFGPYRQSERRAIHAAHAHQLVEKGDAYRCFCSRERLETLREAQRAAKGPLGYDGHCRLLADDEIAEQLAKSRPFTIRMKMPEGGETVVHDRLRGEVRFPNDNVDDQVLLKSDGFPTYHLANVVDDHLMAITHVIRAEEWISSTPKHVILYGMFGWTPPVFIHLPLLRNKDTSKISKRKNPVSILDYRRRGFLPEAVVNFLALLGWSMPDGRELFSLQEFISAFDLERVSLTGPVFDLEKLKWLNGKYFREKLTEDELAVLIHEEILSKEYIRKIIPLIRERIDVGEDFISSTDYFFRGDLAIDPDALVPKGHSPKDVEKALEFYTEAIEAQVDFSSANLERIARRVAEETGWSSSDLFMVLRVATTGRSATPPLFDTLSVLGRALVRRRLRFAMGLTKAHGRTTRPGKVAQNNATTTEETPTRTAETASKADETASKAGETASKADETASRAAAKAAAKADRRALVEALRSDRTREDAARVLGVPVSVIDERIDQFRVKPVEWEASSRGSADASAQHNPPGERAKGSS